MVKTITIGKDQSIELNSSMGWLYVYQEQFGHDVLVVIMPAIEAGLNAAFDVAQSSNPEVMKSGNVLDIFRGLDKDVFMDAMISLSGMQLSTFVNIAWAMAKNASDDIPEPRTWANGFEVFPMDIIMPEVLKLIVSSCVSKKNRANLSAVTETLKKTPSESSSAPLPESTEG